MATFLEHIKHLYGDQARAQTACILEAAGLPDAAPGEYLDGVGNATLFLNRYGLTLRVGHAMRCPEHDLILRPFRRLDSTYGHDSDKITAALLPGVEGVLKGLDDLDNLIAALGNDEIWFSDEALANGGYIPFKTPDMPDGLPVVLDRGGLMCPPNKRYQTTPLKGIFNKSAFTGMQARIYQPLMASLKQCWPNDGTLPPASLQPFLERCAAEIAKPTDDPTRLLSNEWDKNWTSYWQSKPGQVVECAHNYEQQLARKGLRPVGPL